MLKVDCLHHQYSTQGTRELIDHRGSHYGETLSCKALSFYDHWITWARFLVRCPGSNRYFYLSKRQVPRQDSRWFYSPPADYTFSETHLLINWPVTLHKVTLTLILTGMSLAKVPEGGGLVVFLRPSIPIASDNAFFHISSCIPPHKVRARSIQPLTLQ